METELNIYKLVKKNQQNKSNNKFQTDVPRDAEKYLCFFSGSPQNLSCTYDDEENSNKVSQDKDG